MSLWRIQECGHQRATTWIIILAEISCSGACMPTLDSGSGSLQRKQRFRLPCCQHKVLSSMHASTRLHVNIKLHGFDIPFANFPALLFHPLAYRLALS